MTNSVVVVGGGVAGLAAAWELTGGANGPTPDSPRVEVLEADDDFGGALRVRDFAGRDVDRGPDGFLARRPEAVTLVTELGRANDLEAIGAHGASLWVGGRLNPLPEGLLLGLPVRSSQVRAVAGLPRRAKWAARRDEWFPSRLRVNDDATIGQIVRAKLGDTLALQFVEPMIGGIQAGRIDELSAASVVPPLLAAARQGGSLQRALARLAPPPASDGARSPLFYSLRGGVGSLPVTLVEQLRARGVVLRTGARVNALRATPAGAYRWEVDTETTTTPASHVLLATPLSVTARLAGHVDPALAALGEVPAAGAAMVMISAPRDDVTLPAEGTGVLVPLGSPGPRGESLLTTALTFLDRKWPRLQREDSTLLRVHVGRIDDQRWAELSDDELVARVHEELTLLLPRWRQTGTAFVQRWPDALPQYLVGHDALVERARRAAEPAGLALIGMGYDGVGIPASIGAARRGANWVLTQLAPTN